MESQRTSYRLYQQRILAFLGNFLLQGQNHPLHDSHDFSLVHINDRSLQGLVDTRNFLQIVCDSGRNCKVNPDV